MATPTLIQPLDEEPPSTSDIKKWKQERLLEKKKDLMLIRQSYSSSYDCLAEIMQNSVDGIEERWKLEGKKNTFKGKIDISIDMTNDSITVVDNGIGIPIDNSDVFFKPRASTKNSNILENESRGYKGVGACYLAYGFKAIQVASKHSGVSWGLRLDGGKDWVDDIGNTLPSPMAASYSEQFGTYKKLVSGTLVRLFLQPKCKPSSVANFGGKGRSKTYERWKMILRTRTAIGRISLEGASPNYPFKLSCQIRIKEATKWKKWHDVECYFPFVKQRNCGYQTKFLNMKKFLAASVTNAHHAKYRFKHGIFSYWSTDDIVQTLEDAKTTTSTYLDRVDVDGLVDWTKTKKANFYTVLVNSKTKLNDDESSPPCGYFVASKQMVLRKPEIPDFRRYPHHNRQTLSIIQLEGIETDFGRKSFTDPNVDTLCRFMANHANNYFCKFHKKYLDTQSSSSSTGSGGSSGGGSSGGGSSGGGSSGGIPSAVKKKSNIAVLIEDDDNHLPLYGEEKGHQYILEPRREQGVVALWNQLISAGILKGYSVARSFTTEWTYDSIAQYIHQNTSDFNYDEIDCPLGLPTNILSQDPLDMPIVVELKNPLHSVIDDIRDVDDAKKFNEMDLIVAWDEGSNLENGTYHEYRLQQVCYDGSEIDRKYFGQTHFLTDEVIEVPVILLKYLLDIASANNEHKYHIMHNHHDAGS